MDYPAYVYPRGLIANLALDTLLLRRRDFRQDAQACLANLRPSLQVLGAEYIPQRGPCVVTVNHYFRAGFSAQWLALAITAIVPAEMHWIMTGELTYTGKWYAPLGQVASRFILHRLARIYGFTSMSPMPPRPRDVEERAEAVRAVLNVIKATPNLIVGLAPEGGDSADGQLAWPASGLGRFGLLLARAGLKFVPVGAYEAKGNFILHFGPPYDLKLDPGLSADQKDLQSARVIMTNIARLLPENLQGEFG